MVEGEKEETWKIKKMKERWRESGREVHCVTKKGEKEGRVKGQEGREGGGRKGKMLRVEVRAGARERVMLPLNTVSGKQ